MEIMLKIQMTSILVMTTCALVIFMDGRPASKVPMWKMVIVIIPFLTSAVTIFTTTLLRIWL